MCFQLSAATSYDERAALRKALREVKKSGGTSTHSSRRGMSVYNRLVYLYVEQLIYPVLCVDLLDEMYQIRKVSPKSLFL